MNDRSSEIRSLEHVADESLDRVGGKARSLGQMIAAGLPVPPGFCLTTDAYRRLQGLSLSSDTALTAALIEAYHGLGGGAVAVRSSATAEDGETMSFAGQQETILGVEGTDDLLTAVQRCWDSLQSDRSTSYREKQGISQDAVAMAVVVQRMIPADVAGVLFTRDPLDPVGQAMLIEAAWGVGEIVVSGRVTPDRFRMDRESKQILDQQIGHKPIRWSRSGEMAVPEAQQNAFCLDGQTLISLATLGLQVETYFGEPRDLEWALESGTLWLLQARPITTVAQVDIKKLRMREIERLKSIAEPRGTVWSKIHLTEVLAEPTPMSWAICERLMSGTGGIGQMNRDLGGSPDPSLKGQSAYDLIAGRVYCNLNRLPRLQFRHPPIAYPLADYAKNPSIALDPIPMFTPFRFGWRSWLRLPLTLLQLRRMRRIIRQEQATFSTRFRSTILPAYLAELKIAERESLAELSDLSIIERFERWSKRILSDFASESLKPTVLANDLLQQFEMDLRKHAEPAQIRQIIATLVQMARPDADADFASAMEDLTHGEISTTTFLSQFGHRGASEMELAQPRWSETPEAIDALVGTASGATRKRTLPPTISEEQRAIIESAGLTDAMTQLPELLGLRETGKHNLMRGFAELRRMLLVLDSRFGLNGLVFFLTPEELPQLATNPQLRSIARQREQERKALLRLPLPSVIFSTKLDQLGRVDDSTFEEIGTTRTGIAIAQGMAEGLAVVRTTPSLDGLPVEPFILVCPSTDPAWVPLFARAKGVILETGGVLSHGAIVAREFGLPAVAGLPGIVAQIRDGQRVRVDGDAGTVTVLS